jgi:hypothetical protein
MAGLKSKIGQNCKFHEYTDDVAVYSVNRYLIIEVSEYIEIYLKENGLDIAPNK